MAYRKSLLFGGLSALLVAHGWAQEFRATVTGVVTDTSGGVIPGAIISIIQVDTKAVFRTVSGPSGLYTLPLQPPAVYTLTVEAAGFDKYQRVGAELTSNQHAVIDVTLQLGNIAETVTVTGAAPLLDAASAAVGQPIDATLLNDLPQNGRSTMAVAGSKLGGAPLMIPGPIQPSSFTENTTYESKETKCRHRWPGVRQGIHSHLSEPPPDQHVRDLSADEGEAG